MNLNALVRSLALVLIAGNAIAADSKKEARVTQIVRDVRLMPEDAATRPASMNDKVNEDTGVRTGGESRSELTFVDLTITRLGSNTIFSFNKAGHNTQIESGSMLFRVPKNSGGGRITSSGVSVAITGTTVILECTRGNKLYVLEGGARISLIKYPSQFQNLGAGQMVDVPPGAKTIPPPTNFDLNDLMKKHPLITEFPPLPSRDLIAAAAHRQPPQSGASIFPIVPVVTFPGGGVNVGPGRPGGSGGGTRGGRNQPGGQTQPPPGTNQPGTGQGTPVGPNRPPPTSVVGTGQAPVANPGKPTTTPPPVIYRQPGQTIGQPAGTTTRTRPRSTPPPRKRVIRKPNQTTSGPR